jgi:16S rRNA processing protein RimM
VPPAPGDLEIGRIGGAHGLRGEVSVAFVTNRLERAAPGAVLRAGDRVLVVESARRHHNRWLIRFEGIADRAGAERLRGAVLTAPPLDGDDTLVTGEFWVHELIGSRVVDADGAALGTVVAVEANPAHDLLVLDGGALVPMTFVVDRRDDAIVVDVPEGLLDV